MKNVRHGFGRYGSQKRQKSVLSGGCRNPTYYLASSFAFFVLALCVWKKCKCVCNALAKHCPPKVSYFFV